MKKTLLKLEFTKVENVSDYAEFEVKGDIIKFWPKLTELPYVVSFFDQELEFCKVIDVNDESDDILKQKYLELQQSKSAFEQFTKLHSKDAISAAINKFENWIDFIVYLQLQVEPGDYLVHEDNGVAEYIGITMKRSEFYFELKYAAEDKLFVHYSQIHRLTRYFGPEGIKPKVTKLSGGEWKRILKKVKEDTAKFAKELVLQDALRSLTDAPNILTTTELYTEFCDDFPYSLTYDQEKSIQDIEEDLHSQKSMNRLLVGDVGFGKTEVAMRAAFQVVESGFQIAMLCPTTILAAQHYKLFYDRFKKFGIKVSMISSFHSVKENFDNIQNLGNGKVEIVIGTHRLLSNDVKFKNLGLLIVDEEQKFGVRQKEKLKSLRFGVHILSMSATPIPRTLSLALSKIQDISIISTPPLGRKDIKTLLYELDWNIVKYAIEFELKRKGQLYFVHNDIKTIFTIKHKLEKLVPKLRIAVAFSENNVLHEKVNLNLEQTMEDFYNYKYDILLCSTIIENGIDMPNVNTIIINNAQNFGLSQLHQLRGRVGRSESQAYCYLFYKQKPDYRQVIKFPTTKHRKFKFKKDEENYTKRLEVLVGSSSLNSGFIIASRDLEIRGAGNILGKEQSGNINLIGYGMYLKLLEEEIAKMNSNK
ncbi:DEAD/DEAH box helicase [bacterium]|nr:MAG: DEAD/DEAH box helicase [bacterium]